MILPSGVAQLDRLMMGGLQARKFTHVYGKAASGKTTLALQFASSAWKLGFGTIYVNAESGSPVARLEQMSGRVYTDLENRVKILSPRGFEEQGALIDDIELYAREDTMIIIVDTLTRQYRLALDSRKTNYANHRELNRQAGVLKGLARNRGLAVLVLNQVTSRPHSEEDFEPVARNILSYWSDVTVEMRATGRKAERVVTRIEPTGHPSEERFYLSSDGLSLEQPNEKE